MPSKIHGARAAATAGEGFLCFFEARWMRRKRDERDERDADMRDSFDPRTQVRQGPRRGKRAAMKGSRRDGADEEIGYLDLLREPAGGERLRRHRVE